MWWEIYIYIVAEKKEKEKLQYGKGWKRIASHLSVFHHTKSSNNNNVVFLEHSRHFFMNENDDNRGKRRWKIRRRMRKSWLKGRRIKKGMKKNSKCYTIIFPCVFWDSKVKMSCYDAVFPFYLSAFLSLFLYLSDQINILYKFDWIFTWESCEDWI